jgi:hypothetical protein
VVSTLTCLLRDAENADEGGAHDADEQPGESDTDVGKVSRECARRSRATHR